MKGNTPNKEDLCAAKKGLPFHPRLSVGVIQIQLLRSCLGTMQYITNITLTNLRKSSLSQFYNLLYDLVALQQFRLIQEYTREAIKTTINRNKN